MVNEPPGGAGAGVATVVLVGVGANVDPGDSVVVSETASVRSAGPEHATAIKPMTSADRKRLFQQLGTEMRGFSLMAQILEPYPVDAEALSSSPECHRASSEAGVQSGHRGE